MAISRQWNILGQARVDLPHLRAVESAVANDFDVLAGKMLSGKTPIVLKGFTLGSVNSTGISATSLQLNVAGSLIMHFNASEAGTIFSVAENVAAEILSTTNSKVDGSFVANVINYVGIDLIRSADTSTSDLVEFLDLSSNSETPQTVPLARTLQYKIIISTQNFTVSSNVLPIAEVLTSSTNTVVSITDARRLMFRLGSGGDNPSALSAFSWGNRTENPITYTGGTLDPFIGEDKSITNLKSWMDAMMTTLWEAKGGAAWYSAANRDNVKVLYGQPVLVNGDNFYFPIAITTANNATRVANVVTVTYNNHPFATNQIIDVKSADSNFPSGTKTITGTALNTFNYSETGANVTGSGANAFVVSSLLWESVSLAFENSAGYINTITNSSANGIALPDGYALYVDLVRESNATIFANIAPLVSLGYSVVPGRRFILAWRNGNYVFSRDRSYETGRTFIAATTSALGVVRLNNTAGNPTSPQVVSIMSNGQAEVLANAASNSYAIKGTGDGTGAGFFGIGGASAGAGIVVSGGTFGGNGVTATGGTSSGTGVFATGGAANGRGIISVGTGTGSGVEGNGGSTSGYGVAGSGGTPNGIGVGGFGNGSGAGGSFLSFGTGLGISATGGTGGVGALIQGGTGATGIQATGGAGGFGIDGTGGTNASGIRGFGTGTGNGIEGYGGSSSGAGVVGTGGTNGIGVQGSGLGTGAGVSGVAAGTGAGVKGQGTGTGSGGDFTGGTTSGHGVIAVGYSPGAGGHFNNANTGYGVYAKSAGGIGLYAEGGGVAGLGVQALGSLGPAIYASRGDSTSQPVITSVGSIDLDSSTNVSNGTAIKNRLTRHLIPKAYGNCTSNLNVIDGNAAGQNVTSVVSDSTKVTVTLAQAMSGVLYTVLVTPLSVATPFIPTVSIVSTTQFQISFRGIASVGPLVYSTLDPSATPFIFSFAVFGEQ